MVFNVYDKKSSLSSKSVY